MGAAQQWWSSCLLDANFGNGWQSENKETVGMVLDFFTQDEVMTQWSINQSMTGKDTISAGEQYTSPDHLGHYAAHWPYVNWRWRLDDGEVGHANTNGEGKKRTNKQSETNTKRMAVRWWVEMKMVEHAVAARNLKSSKHVDENVQPMTVQKASNTVNNTGLFWLLTTLHALAQNNEFMPRTDQWKMRQSRGTKTVKNMKKHL